MKICSIYLNKIRKINTKKQLWILKERLTFLKKEKLIFMPYEIELLFLFKSLNAWMIFRIFTDSKSDLYISFTSISYFTQWNTFFRKLFRHSKHYSWPPSNKTSIKFPFLHLSKVPISQAIKLLMFLSWIKVSPVTFFKNILTFWSFLRHYSLLWLKRKIKFSWIK